MNRLFEICSLWDALADIVGKTATNPESNNTIVGIPEIILDFTNYYSLSASRHILIYKIIREFSSL